MSDVLNLSMMRRDGIDAMVLKHVHDMALLVKPFPPTTEAERHSLEVLLETLEESVARVRELLEAAREVVA